VGTKTVKHLLRAELAHRVWGGDFAFCSSGECEVYYVRLRESHRARIPQSAENPPGTMTLEVYTAEHIKERARPHARGAERLICHCFGYTAGDIAEDARNGGRHIPEAIAAEVRAGMCACEVLNPGGG
jgi:hypothetical protein